MTNSFSKLLPSFSRISNALSTKKIIKPSSTPSSKSKKLPENHVIVLNPFKENQTLPNPIKITLNARVPFQSTVSVNPSVSKARPALISSNVHKSLTLQKKKESNPNCTLKPTTLNQIISHVITNNPAL